MSNTPIAYTIMSGNPVEGFTLYGQFATNDAACEAANNDAHLANEWWVVPIHGLDADTETHTVDALHAPIGARGKQAIYTVPITFTFEGSVKAEASSPDDAKQIVESSFGLTLNGGLHESDSRIRDWSFDSHSEKRIGQPYEN
jgi:hypothetical protein